MNFRSIDCHKEPLVLQQRTQNDLEKVIGNTPKLSHHPDTGDVTSYSYDIYFIHSLHFVSY